MSNETEATYIPPDEAASQLAGPPAISGVPAGSPPVSSPATTPTKLKEIAGFEILGKLGQGGMGAVFKARQKSLDRVVALKVLPPSIAKDAKFIERFQREARASARLNHPNIVQGIDVGKDPATGLWFFAMEYVDGPTLKKVLEEQKVIPEERALAIVKEVARALETIGSHQMVHRDIKPDNILLTQRGEAKLADLGLAKQMNEDASITQSGQTVGTPHYMAPEQVRGKFEECDIRTDIYALGGTLFHLVTGRPPFEGQTSAVIMSKHLTDAPPKASKVNPEVSEQCSRMIEKMMQKKIELRIQRPSELVAAIEKIQKGEGTGAHSHVSKTTGPRVPIGERRPREDAEPEGKNQNLIYAAVAGVAIVAILAFALKGGGKPEPAPGPVADGGKKLVVNPGGGAEKITPEMKGPGQKEPVKAPPPKVPTVSPDELLKAAQEFEQKNPDAFDDIAQRYQRAHQAAKGSDKESEFQDKVDDALAALQTRQQAAAEKAWKAADEKAQALVSLGNYDEALNAYQTLPPKLAGMLREKVDEKTRALHQEAEAKVSAIAKKAEAQSADVEPGEGLKTIAEAEKINYAPTRGIVTALKKKLTDELANEAELKEKKGMLVAEKRLDEVMKKFDQALLEAKDAKAASEIAAEAKKDTALAPVEPMVRAMNEVMAAFDDSARFETEQLQKLVGQKVELEHTGGVSKGVIQKIQDGVISQQIDFGGGATGSKKFKVSDLTEAYRKKIFPPFVPQTDPQRLALCYSKLAKGTQDFTGAMEQLLLSPDYALTAHCKELANKVRGDKEKVLLEAAAPAFWGEIQTRAIPLKLSDADAKTLSEKIAKFEKEYGATDFAATIKDKLESIKTRIAKMAAPNLIVNGDFEKGLEPWERDKKGGSASFQLSNEGGHSGKSCALFNIQPDYFAAISQAIAVEPRVEYKVSAWFKLAKGSLEFAPRSGLFILEGDSTERKEGEGHAISVQTLLHGNEWTHLEMKFVPQTASIKVDLFMRMRRVGVGTYTVLVDDVEVSKVAGGGGGEKGAVSPLPPAPVPDLFKAAGLVFWVSPASDPANTTREMLTNVMSTDKGTVTVVPDAGMKVMQFNDSYAYYNATEAVKSISATGSIFVWVKTEKLPPAFQSMIFRGDQLTGANGHADFSLFWKGDKAMLWFNYPENQWPGVDGKSAFYTKKPLVAGKWTMIGATWDGKTVTMWVNGERDNVYQSSASPLKRSFAEIVALGCDPAGSPEYFNGMMNGAMIFNRAISEFEIKSFYVMSNIAGK
jgi:tetratricopeptide (TPR) repeat protein/predicted Ser/Thr protein kinase